MHSCWIIVINFLTNKNLLTLNICTVVYPVNQWFPTIILEAPQTRDGHFWQFLISKLWKNQSSRCRRKCCYNQSDLVSPRSLFSWSIIAVIMTEYSIAVAHPYLKTSCFLCLLNQTHLIQIISLKDLKWVWQTKREMQNLQCWGASRNVVGNHCCKSHWI